MDLPYPTVKNVAQDDLNQLDKLARSILLSTHDIPKQVSVSKSLKSKILKTINSDNAYSLHRIVEKQVINFTIQIGTRGSRWNILHFCAKSNAHQCIQYILKTQFQHCPQEYKQLVNNKTIQGYSMITIAIINHSHKALEKALQYGGVDIHILDQHKNGLHQIAMNYKNFKAIQLTSAYQSRTRKKQFINKQALSVYFQFPKLSFMQEMTICLIGCLTLGYYQPSQFFQQKQDNKLKISDYIIQEQCVDYVAINSKKDLKGYDIEWKRVTELMKQKVTVFDSYNPFQIVQSNFTIKNNLIVFQCLSQQPWLIRRLIKPDRCRNNSYNIFLYPKKIMQKQTIDDYIPFIKDRNQTMFLSNQKQMWPMLLQKALAKLYHSYFSIAQIDPRTLLQQITGFPTIQININLIPDDKLSTFFQELSSRNYLYMLKGKKQGDLIQQYGKEQCFTILNFYQRKSQQLLLINCPFISQKWKKKQKQEIMQMKLIKSHYNTHKQMCVWIQALKIKQYFQTVIISLTFLNYQRAELKIKAKQFVFFKFRIQNKREQNIYFQLFNSESEQVYNLANLQIIKNEGKQLIQPLQSQIYYEKANLSQIKCDPGQYMCCYQIQQCQKFKSLMLISWASELLQPECVQSELGKLQWLGFLKNHFQKVKQQCVLEVIGQFSLVLFRQNTNEIVLFRKTIDPQHIIEGKHDPVTGFVQMVSENSIYYCVLKCILNTEDIVFDTKSRN